MLPQVYQQIVLAFSTFLNSSKSHSCPQWTSTMLGSTLSTHTNWPGIQLTLSSPYCGLDCTTSVQVKGGRFVDQPALLDDTPWRLASITKTYTAVAILKLFEEARLDLHTPAVQHLPTWATELVQQSQGLEDAAQITPWHLLHHTSGLGDFASDKRWQEEVFNEPQHMWTQESLIEWSTINSKRVGKPGEKFHYTDTGYTLLGLMLENITRTDLATAVRDLAGLNRLGLSATWWEMLEQPPDDPLKRARQYYDTLDVTDFNPSFDLYGAGGLIGNSKDLNRFGRAVYEGRLLNKTTTQLLYVLDSSKFYGSGIVNYTFAGQQAWGHTGFWHTWLYWVPSLDLVISGANNQAAGDAFNAGELVRNVIDHGCVPRKVAA